MRQAGQIPFSPAGRSFSPVWSSEWPSPPRQDGRIHGRLPARPCLEDSSQPTDGRRHDLEAISHRKRSLHRTAAHAVTAYGDVARHRKSPLLVNVLSLSSWAQMRQRTERTRCTRARRTRRVTMEDRRDAPSPRERHPRTVLPTPPSPMRSPARSVFSTRLWTGPGRRTGWCSTRRPFPHRTASTSSTSARCSSGT